MSGINDVAISHFGICVSDLERSLAFYTEALGFELGHGLEFGGDVEALTEIPGIAGQARFLKRGGAMIELLKYTSPGETGPAQRRAMNQLGISHISLVVSDLVTVAGRIEQFAGTALRHTRVTTPKGDMMFCTDPDGTRIELWARVD